MKNYQAKKKLEEEVTKVDAIQESTISLQKKNNNINIDENNEEKINKNEIIKLKMNIDNLKKENSLLKYRLSIFNTNNSNNLIKELESISKEKKEINAKLDNLMKENNDIISKYYIQ